MPTIAPYGSWISPFRAGEVSSGTLSFGGIQATQDSLCWLEYRPGESGRGVIVRKAGGSIVDVTPRGRNVRSRVHEYGGGAFAVWKDVVVFANLEDQRLYRQVGNGPPRSITQAAGIDAGHRFADLRFSPDGTWIVCVQEVHRQAVPTVNRLVVLPSDGSGPPRPIAEGRDFYSSPRLSPDGRHLAWLEWDHPNMPWDGTELWIADMQEDRTITEPRQVAGGVAESIFQPEWSPKGVLHFVSDRSGWWNLYRLGESEVAAIAPRSAEFGSPAWTFGQSHYDFLPDGRIVCLIHDQGSATLEVIATESGERTAIPIPWTTFMRDLTAEPGGDRIWITAASPTRPYTLLEVDTRTHQVTEVRSSASFPITDSYISAPESIWFPNREGEQVHAFYYAAHNPDFQAPEGEKAPLLVTCHGGPTSQAFPDLKPSYQYWTSRGFAILDVNHGGSTGFGRAYRERLVGKWGLLDATDCVDGARDQARKGRVDEGRLAIRGGSAGGFTTLCALTFHDAFRAGAAYYAVADLEALARETHKFESRYLDRLIGPYPEAAAVYRERSPLYSADRISRPVIFFQGLEDQVVPPAQAEAMVAALKARGVPHAYLAFAGESHGFRAAKVRARCLEAELYFYSKILGFELGEAVEPAPIIGLQSPAQVVGDTNDQTGLS
jgi:dipeptidyl aminopeptidase/acylaminoacyl peptidase